MKPLPPVPLKTLILSFALVLGVETGIAFLPLPPPWPTALARSLELFFLLLLLRATPGGLAGAGLSRETLWLGLALGATWSLIFGLAVALAAGIFYLAGGDPLAFFTPAFPPPLTPAFLARGIFIQVVLAPPAEEIFFRGILQGFFRPLGRFFAIALAAIFFAALHSGGGLPPIPLIGGVLFGLALEKSKGLWASILIHALGNFFLFLCNFLPCFMGTK